MLWVVRLARRSTKAKTSTMFSFEITGILGLIVLVLMLWAIVSTIGSRASTGAKVLWILAILFFPLLGFIAWLIFGPKSK